MSKRDFLSLSDLTKSEIQAVLARAAYLKAERAAGRQQTSLAGRTLGMIFNKPSTRTRVSFQVGIYELGGRVVYMQESETQIGRHEPPSHTARVLSRYLDALIIRTFIHDDVENLARYAAIPVINALTDKSHPCQVLSDLLTVIEKKGTFDGLKVAWIGDGNNVAYSWIEAAGLMGFTLTLAVPEGYDPDPTILAAARSRSTAPIVLTRDPVEAVREAQVINTDVWASMGQETQASSRAKVFQAYQVNAALLALAAPDAIVLHCLPAHLGEEITDEVIEGAHSVVFDQAENRLHAQKALLEFIFSAG